MFGRERKNPVWRDKDGNRLMLIVTSNSYQDREGETITTDALKAWCERQWEGDKYVGTNPLLFWHDDRVKMGDIIFSDVSGAFLIEVARETDDPLASILWDYAENHPHAGASHRFTFDEADLDTGVFKRIEKQETTWLPRNMAANLLTYAGVIGMDKREVFDEIVGVEGASDLLDKGIGALVEELKQRGIQHKQLAGDTARLQLEVIKQIGQLATGKTNDMELDKLLALYKKAYEGDPVEELLDEAKEDEMIEVEGETVDPMEARLTALETAIAELASMIKGMVEAKMDEEVAVELPLPEKSFAPRMAKRASQSATTIIDLDNAPDALKEWGQEYDNFFGHKIRKSAK
jgi:hypothetical protein